MDGDAKKQRTQKMREKIGCHQTASSPQHRQPESISKNEMADIRALRAQCKPDAQLFEALCHGVGQHRVNPHSCQDQSQAGERTPEPKWPE